MNRKIPRVAFASLVAGVAVACGDDPSDAERLAKAYCREYDCEDPSGFALDYASMAQCVRENTAYYDNILDDYVAAYGGACAHAYANFYVCDDTADLQVCRDGTATIDCSDEYARWLALCD